MIMMPCDCDMRATQVSKAQPDPIQVSAASKRISVKLVIASSETAYCQVDCHAETLHVNMHPAPPKLHVVTWSQTRQAPFKDTAHIVAYFMSRAKKPNIYMSVFSNYIVDYTIM